MDDDIVRSTADVLGLMAHGVAVITLTDDAGTRRGMTVSSLISASAEPPMVLMCIRTRASMWPWFTPGRVLGISLLAPGQAAVSNGFAFGVDDPFAVFPWHEAPGGAAIVDGCAAHMVGVVDRVVDNHDTGVVLARVTAAGRHADRALVHCGRSYYDDLVPAAG